VENTEINCCLGCEKILTARNKKVKMERASSSSSSLVEQARYEQIRACLAYLLVDDQKYSFQLAAFKASQKQQAKKLLQAHTTYATNTNTTSLAHQRCLSLYNKTKNSCSSPPLSQRRHSVTVPINRMRRRRHSLSYARRRHSLTSSPRHATSKLLGRPRRKSQDVRIAMHSSSDDSTRRVKRRKSLDSDTSGVFRSQLRRLQQHAEHGEYSYRHAQQHTQTQAEALEAAQAWVEEQTQLRRQAQAQAQAQVAQAQAAANAVANDLPFDMDARRERRDSRDSMSFTHTPPMSPASSLRSPISPLHVHARRTIFTFSASTHAHLLQIQQQQEEVQHTHTNTRRTHTHAHTLPVRLQVHAEENNNNNKGFSLFTTGSDDDVFIPITEYHSTSFFQNMNETTHTHTQLPQHHHLHHHNYYSTNTNNNGTATHSSSSASRNSKSNSNSTSNSNNNKKNSNSNNNKKNNNNNNNNNENKKTNATTKEEPQSMKMNINNNNSNNDDIIMNNNNDNAIWSVCASPHTHFGRRVDDTHTHTHTHTHTDLLFPRQTPVIFS